MRRVSEKVVILWMMLAGSSFAAEISLASQISSPGSSVLLPVSLTVADGLGSIQFDIDYDSSAMSIAATLADSSRNAAKSIFLVDVTPSKRRFLLAGLNQNSVASGMVINLLVNLTSTAAKGVYDLKFSNVAGSDPFGIIAPVAGADAAVTVDSSAGQPIPLLPAGVLNLASQTPGSVAPGEIFELIGSAIGPASPVQPGANTSANGLSVLFDGTPAPLLYASPNEIHAIVPYEVSGQASTEMSVLRSGSVIAELTLPIANASPALFTLYETGAGPGAILNQDATLNSPWNPATSGSVLVLYATGTGQTNPPGADGAVSGSTLSTSVLPVSVQIGGINAQVLYAGSAPGLISGVLQVNCKIPDGSPSGSAVPVTLTAGTAKSVLGVTVAIQ